MTRPVLVLQVLSGLGMGGAETWLMELLRHWSHTGSVQTDFLLTGGSPDLFDQEAQALGASLHYLPYRRSRLRRFIGAYRRILAEGRYDAIHDHSDYSAGWRFAFGIGVNPAVRIAHIHNPWLHIQANYSINRSRQLAAGCGKALVQSLATHVCGTSSETLSTYGFNPASHSAPQVSVLHCGFDVGRFNKPREGDRSQILAEFDWPPATKLVLIAGRLDRALKLHDPQNHKNTWLALQIVRTALVRDTGIRCIFAGDGPSRGDLIQAVQEWGLSDQIKLPGIRRDVPALMRAADLLLFPSAQEGLGMVAVEAQAAGLPVLTSTAVPREACVLPELYTALPLDASFAAWADQLVGLALQPRISPARCRSALEASPYSITTSAQQLEAIYRSGRKQLRQ